MANVNNFGVLRGKLVAEPNYTPHADGSKTVFLKLAVQDNFKRKNVKQADGNLGEGYATQFITVQGFVGANPKNPAYPNGVYGLLEVGMELAVEVHLESYVVPGGARDAAGNPCNRWEQCVRIDKVQLVETKEQATLRRAKQAKKLADRTAKTTAQAPVAAAPAMPAAPAMTGVDAFEGDFPANLDL